MGRDGECVPYGLNVFSCEAGTKGPHPAFGHPLPSCSAFGYAGQARAIISWAFARERSEWEKVGEARMRALWFSIFRHQHLDPPAFSRECKASLPPKKILLQFREGPLVHVFFRVRD